MRGKNNRDYVFFVLCVFIATLVLMVVPQSGEAQDPGVALTGYGTATVDGILSPGEWDSADILSFDVNLPSGNTAPGNLFVMNDAEHLYFAFQFDAFVTGENYIRLRFDNDNDGVVEYGDDVFGLRGYAPNIASFNDYWRTDDPPCNVSAPNFCTDRDSAFGGTIDGEGGFSNNTGTTIFEISRPLLSSDYLHDFNVFPGDVIGFQVRLNMGFPDPNSAETWWPSRTAYGGGDILIASPDATQGNQRKPRTVMLLHPNNTDPNSKNAEFSAKVVIFPWDTNPNSDNIQVPYAKINTTNLWCLAWDSNQFYTLYAHTPSLGLIRLRNFNTSCDAGVSQAGLYLPFDDDAWFTEPLTLEIYVEDDDGIDEPDRRNPRLRLRGED